MWAPVRPSRVRQVHGVRRLGRQAPVHLLNLARARNDLIEAAATYTDLEQRRNDAADRVNAAIVRPAAPG